MRSKAYETSDAYRFMEALRNHVQHRGAAVHGMGEAAITGRRVEGWAETVSIWAEREMLQQDTGFKASVLAEMPDQVDLRAFAKRYVSSISLLHVRLREHLNEVISNARDLIGRAVERYKVELNAEVAGLNAYSVGHDEVGHRVPVMLNWDDVRRKMAEKNRWPLRIDPDVSKKW